METVYSDKSGYFGLSRRLLTLLDRLPGSVVVTDTDHRYTYANAAYCRLVSRPRNRIVGRHVRDVIGVEGWRRVGPHLERALSGDHHTYESRPEFAHRKGSVFEVEFLPCGYGDDVDGVIGVVADISRFKSVEARLDYDASHDALTGVYNRGFVERAIRECTEIARKTGDRHALLLVDLDRFKRVNDQCGHLAGDQCLKQVAQHLRNCVRREDIVARFGGDEFVILLTGCRLREARQVARKLLDRSRSATFEAGDRRFTIGFSIGMVEVSGDSTLRDVISRADKACYISKRKGGFRATDLDP